MQVFAWTGTPLRLAYTSATRNGCITTSSRQVVSTTSGAQFVSVQNTSASTVTGITVATSGANAADFTISGNSCGTTLTSGSACNFNVTFKPAAAGARTAAVTINDSAGTQTMTLAGFGVASFTSALLVDSALFFPSETVGFPSPSQNITFQNTGNTAFTIQSVVLAGANPGDFGVSSSCPISPSVFSAFSIALARIFTASRGMFAGPNTPAQARM